MYSVAASASIRPGNCRGPLGLYPVTDTPSDPTTLPASSPQTLNLGFLTIVQDGSGVFGGYLVTNSWGRPLEFRLTTAVQPNRVQQILYGPTLTEYLHAELIGKTLVEKTSVAPSLVITDSLPALGLRDRLQIPVVALRTGTTDDGPEVLQLTHPRSSVMLAYLAKYPDDKAAIDERLDRIDSAVDLAEPFARIREAVAEARKMGVTSRAA